MRQAVVQIRWAGRIVAALVMTMTAVGVFGAPSLRAGVIEPHITASVDVDSAPPGTGVGVRVACETDGSPADFVTAVLESLDYESLSFTQVQLADAHEAWMRLIIPPETTPGDYSVWSLCQWSDTGGATLRVPFTVTAEPPVDPPPGLIEATTSPTSGPPKTLIATDVSCIAPDDTPATDVRSVIGLPGLVVSSIGEASQPLDAEGAGTVAVPAPDYSPIPDLLVLTTCYLQGVALATHSQAFELQPAPTPTTGSSPDAEAARPAATIAPRFTG